MDKFKNNKGTPTKRTSTENRINLDYDFNTEYGDGDIPNVDKPKDLIVYPDDDRPRRDGPGGE